MNVRVLHGGAILEKWNSTAIQELAVIDAVNAVCRVFRVTSVIPRDRQADASVAARGKRALLRFLCLTKQKERQSQL